MMKDLKTALELRKRIKGKKPVFLKQDAHKKVRLRKNWRQPRGRHSKMRLKLRGHRKQPSVGYSSPKIVKGLNPQGLKEVRVYNLEDLKNVGKTEGIIIGRTVGLRKKLKLLKKIKEKKDLKLLNVKDIENFIKEIEEKFLAKKKESKEKEEEKKKSKEEAIKKAEERKKKEEEKTEEEKKKEAEERAKEEARQKAMQMPVKE